MDDRLGLPSPEELPAAAAGAGGADATLANSPRTCARGSSGQRSREGAGRGRPGRGRLRAAAGAGRPQPRDRHGSAALPLRAHHRLQPRHRAGAGAGAGGRPRRPGPGARHVPLPREGAGKAGPPVPRSPALVRLHALPRSAGSRVSCPSAQGILPLAIRWRRTGGVFYLLALLTGSGCLLPNGSWYKTG